MCQYLNQIYLSNEWHQFLKLPSEKQISEKAATLVSQWLQPGKRVTYRRINDMLEEIVKQIKGVLRFINPRHSIFFKSSELLAKWQNTYILDSDWPGNEYKQIFAAFDEVLYKQLGFRKNNRTKLDSEDYFIDRVNVFILNFLRTNTFFNH